MMPENEVKKTIQQTQLVLHSQTENNIKEIPAEQYNALLSTAIYQELEEKNMQICLLLKTELPLVIQRLMAEYIGVSFFNGLRRALEESIAEIVEISKLNAKAEVERLLTLDTNKLLELEQCTLNRTHALKAICVRHQQFKQLLSILEFIAKPVLNNRLQETIRILNQLLNVDDDQVSLVQGSALDEFKEPFNQLLKAGILSYDNLRDLMLGLMKKFLFKSDSMSSLDLPSAINVVELCYEFYPQKIIQWIGGIQLSTIILRSELEYSYDYYRYLLSYWESSRSSTFQEHSANLLLALMLHRYFCRDLSIIPKEDRLKLLNIMIIALKFCIASGQEKLQKVMIERLNEPHSPLVSLFQEYNFQFPIESNGIITSSPVDLVGYAAKKNQPLLAFHLITKGFPLPSGPIPLDNPNVRPFQSILSYAFSVSDEKLFRLVASHKECKSEWWDGILQYIVGTPVFLNIVKTEYQHVLNRLTTLSIAILTRNIELLNYFRDSNFDVPFPLQEKYRTPLHYLVAKWTKLDQQPASTIERAFLQSLLTFRDAAKWLTLESKDQPTVLEQAKHEPLILEEFLKHPACQEQVVKKQLLHQLVTKSRGNDHIIKAIAQALPSQAFLPDQNGESPLHIAMTSRCFIQVSLLLSTTKSHPSFDIEHTNKAGQTLLERLIKLIHSDNENPVNKLAAQLLELNAGQKTNILSTVCEEHDKGKEVALNFFLCREQGRNIALKAGKPLLLQYSRKEVFFPHTFPALLSYGIPYDCLDEIKDCNPRCEIMLNFYKKALQHLKENEQKYSEACKRTLETPYNNDSHLCNAASLLLKNLVPASKKFNNYKDKYSPEISAKELAAELNVYSSNHPYTKIAWIKDIADKIQLCLRIENDEFPQERLHYLSILLYIQSEIFCKAPTVKILPDLKWMQPKSGVQQDSKLEATTQQNATQTNQP